MDEVLIVTDGVAFSQRFPQSWQTAERGIILAKQGFTLKSP
jgi:hypothetical protein